MAAASSAALRAPARPIASVPTGTPAGIWTIDSSESRPDSARLSTGTPSTGSTVWAAIIPGRWAAPPAPAMITSMPRAAALGELAHPLRRAVGGDHQALVGHAELAERLVGVAHRLPVGGAAHDHRHQGGAGRGPAATTGRPAATTGGPAGTTGEAVREPSRPASVPAGFRRPPLIRPPCAPGGRPPEGRRPVPRRAAGRASPASGRSPPRRPRCRRRRGCGRSRARWRRPGRRSR
jgi:hypothetical protein